MWSTILGVVKAVGMGFLTQLVSLVSQFLKFMIMVKKDQIQGKKEKKTEEFNGRVDGVCNNGNLDDLLDLRRE